MQFLKRAAYRLLRDESGGEVLEYSLVTGVIVVACVPVITHVGVKVLERWNAINAAL